MTEQFTNFATSTLSGSIGSADTSLILVDASKFPSSGNFTMSINPDGTSPEIVTATGRSGNTISGLSRGQEGSTAQVWASGTTVRSALTVQSLKNIIADRRGFTIQIKTANYTAVAGDGVQANATSGALTITLPTNVAGVSVNVTKTDSTTNTVTVSPQSGTINGQSTWVLDTQYAAVTVQCDGTNWIVV